VIFGRTGLGFRLEAGLSVGKIPIALNVRSSLEQGETCTWAAPPTNREGITLHGKHLMRHAVLVVRSCVDARCRHPVTWSKRPSRHSRFSEQGTNAILIRDQLSSNGSIALTLSISDVKSGTSFSP
jgi:hypothetical protein